MTPNDACADGATPARSAPEDLVVPALVGLLLVAASPSVNSPAWTPRAATLLLLTAIGLPTLLRLLRRRDSGAVAGVVFVALCGISAALSPQPILSTLGLYRIGTGLVFVVALAAIFALGRSASEIVRRRARVVVLGAAILNALIGCVQVSVELSYFPFASYAGRGSGLLGNPVQLGTLLAAVLFFLAADAALGRIAWAAMLAVVAAGVGASGSRASFLLTLLVPLVVLVVRRNWRDAAIAAAALTLGMAAMAGFARSGSIEGADRLAEGGSASGIASRIEIWRAGARAVADRPVLGHGPGRFRPATLPHRSLAAVQAEGAGRYFGDAHNLVVEYATTSGVLGLSVLGAWLVIGWRRGRGPWIALCGGLLAGHLVQPQMVGTTPLIFFALGAAQNTDRSAEGRLRWPQGVLALAALLPAATLLAGDFYLDQARLDLETDDARRANRLLPAWPVGTSSVAQAYAFEARVTQDPLAASRSIAWRRSATRRDPLDPSAWTALGNQLFEADRVDEAITSFQRAVDLDQFAVGALNGLAYSATVDRDVPAARRWLERSLRVDPEQPEMKALREQLREL